MANISIQNALAPLQIALHAQFPDRPPYVTVFLGELFGLPLTNQALIAQLGGSELSATRVLEVVTAINPEDVVQAEWQILNPPPTPQPGGTKPPVVVPLPPKRPTLGAEIIGAGDDFFTPFQFFGNGYTGSENVVVMQVLGNSQAPLTAAQATAGSFIVNTSLNNNSHYNVYAIGVTSNVPSDTIGISVP